MTHMTHTRIHRCPLVLLASLLVLMAASAAADTTIWGGSTNYLGYFVDPVSGATLPAPNGILTFGASASPYSGWVFVTTPVTLWKVPIMAAGSPVALGSFTSGAPPTDLAFDASSGMLYGIDQYSSGFYPAGELSIVDYNNCSFFQCLVTPLDVTMLGVQGIDFVPGRGIYGADIDGLLWFFDPKTLQLSFIGSTGVFGITDLAYDSFSRRLIAASVGMKCVFCGPQTGMVWSIDPLTAQAVLLNDNAPAMYGLAEITPEPGSLVLFTTGAVGLLASIRKRIRGDTGKRQWVACVGRRVPRSSLGTLRASELAAEILSEGAAATESKEPAVYAVSVTGTQMQLFYFSATCQAHCPIVAG